MCICPRSTDVVEGSLTSLKFCMRCNDKIEILSMKLQFGRKCKILIRKGGRVNVDGSLSS